jgi:hypothetical protein
MPIQACAVCAYGILCEVTKAKKQKQSRQCDTDQDVKKGSVEKCRVNLYIHIVQCRKKKILGHAIHAILSH